MNHKQFAQLSLRNQYETMISKGVNIAKREEGSYSYFLYQLDSFYAEVIFHSDPHSFTGIKSFSYISIPENYLENIDISSLGIKTTA